MKKRPTDFNGMLYISLLGDAPVITQADDLVTFTTEFLRHTNARGITKILRMPDGSRVLRVTAANRIVLYEVVRNEVTGDYYGRKVDGINVVDS